MASVALFDVVIPAVIGWVLIDDLMHSMREPARIKSVVNNVVALQKNSWKNRERSGAARDLSVTQRLPVIEVRNEPCTAC